MTYLHVEIGLSKINYNKQKDKWKISDLITICVQENARLKKLNMTHLTINGLSKKSFKKGMGKKKET